MTAQGSSSEEYAPRLWQGMLGDYYRRRWALWFDYIERTIGANETYDASEYSDALRDYQVRGLEREKIVCLQANLEALIERPCKPMAAIP